MYYNIQIKSEYTSYAHREQRLSAILLWQWVCAWAHYLVQTHGNSFVADTYAL